MRILALRNPMASDLRRTIGAIRVASDLERIGDLAEGVAKRVLDLEDQTRMDAVTSLKRLGQLVRTQLSAALDAFMRDDMSAAVQVWQSHYQF